MTHTLTADSIQLEFGLRPILSDIYIQCRTGRITGLLGRNGQGKTCLMRAIYGDLACSSRSVRFDDTAVLQPYTRPDLVRYLPQFNFIPGSLTLKRVFNDFNLELRELGDIFPEFRPSCASRIRDLSGGERRLINIYVITRSPSQFVLLDEPFSHLSPLQIEKVKALLTVERQNKGILITDHLYQDILEISDKLYMLLDGRTQLAKGTEDLESSGYLPRR
ncbi:ATP-binding cassette domain-containing protein [Flavitalea sp. BT771]|uniref:ATP-binding cassette domain-containing protein n=1 Tax=Flavitalea sp. BT771 TaxID=3063329 RepID=UPI0026E33BED|nr:ATP-binding cassette domain-containing protein [Flavitalea sp. BT771]MDO6429832.1 ATP-binding cassette domain-containing protein [Flavitalea sp. BT771]MDV6218040.1 ATP-binding cassette domain-containing protein [Flavitalea sp. BT771]